MSPTNYCPALEMELETECPEGDGYYCEGYCPYAPQEEIEQ